MGPQLTPCRVASRSNRSFVDGAYQMCMMIQFAWIGICIMTQTAGLLILQKDLEVS